MDMNREEIMKEKNIYMLVETILEYGISKELIQAEDLIYARNRIYNELKLEGICGVASYEGEHSVSEIMNWIIDWSYDNGILTSKYPNYTDLFDTKLMDIMTPMPSEVNKRFWELYRESPRRATDWYYDFSISTEYIRMNRVSKNIVWKKSTTYGEMVMTINRSKPEKDPKSIIESAKVKSEEYPKCLLCYENVGYYGNANYPARQTHRVIPFTLADEPWFFQYSPYVYYNEHAIVIAKEHKPMKISGKTFERLLDFVDIFPHYFIGSNADLPLVGGSMLSHDHYQAGCYEMPMARADVYKEYKLKQFEGVSCMWLNWPLTVLRLQSEDRIALKKAAEYITDTWRNYTDEAAEILAFTDNEPHHTVTPILRKYDSYYELDIVLRDNRRNDEFPDGIYHPHKEIHPIKKENIGLIEVMGLAVLPDRLAETLDILASGLEKNLEFCEVEELSREYVSGFEDIYNRLKHNYKHGDVLELVKSEFGAIFVEGLKHCGVIENSLAGEGKMEKFILAVNKEA